MSRSIIRMFGLGLVALGVAASGPSLADPHKNESGHPRKERHYDRDDHKNHGKRHEDDDRVVIIERDGARWDRSYRDVVVRYYDSHRYSCPPGLIETRHGCLPRGQAKKRYVIGQPLPRTVIIEDLPYDLRRQLPPPPSGYIYRRVDGDVLLIAEATKKVIDAVVLLSAL
ncbi:RcnB family protein [Pedomonas mirosovicensis]|uniref:RcnB family protein n=1 Tax=Pedomonas mirosovicensis TaxID=2908641 RepID=UPI0021681E39|nr:RcnB family protein [Pedomonas mirosovicensis]MCH8684494.1 RcnB family protein [Pedomonas mirosovicensis]